jgi:hypothetical protein
MVRIISGNKFHILRQWLDVISYHCLFLKIQMINYNEKQISFDI